MQRIIGNNIIKLNAVDSTNTYATALLKNQKVAEGLVITTTNQTAGRGQPGTIWHSDEGKSLTFSVILAPTFLKVEQQFYLSMAISLGLMEYLQVKSIRERLIKWPNDILVHRHKLAGILIENTIQGTTIANSVVGIGININNTQIQLPPNSTSLFIETNRLYDLDAELDEICSQLNKYYLWLLTGKFQKIKDTYFECLLGVSNPVKIRKENEEKTVQVINILDDGKIELKDESGKKFIAGFKEYQWIF